MAGRRRIVTVAGASVVAPTAPTVTAPTEAADIYDGVAVTLTATVTAGQVPDRIDFLLDDSTVIATDSTSPYTQSWVPSGVAAGAHTIKARFVYGSGSVDSAAVNVTAYDSVASRAIAAWVPAGMTESGGKVTAWANSGTGGATYDLASVSGPTDPTYSATGDRAGTGPACTLVRASATKLATGAVAIAHPNTLVWVAKRTAGGAANMRLTDGRTGNTHGFYLNGTSLTVNDGAGTTITSVAAWNQDTWYCLAGMFNGNGASASSNWVTGTELAGTLAGTGCSGIVLGDFGTGGGAAFDGVVERGYLFDWALSDTEYGLLRTELGF